MDNDKTKNTLSFFINNSILAAAVMIILITLCSYSYNLRAKELNQNECFSNLSSSSIDAADGIEGNLQGGLNSMKIIAHMIERAGTLEPDKIAFILSAYDTNNVSTHLGVLTSDDIIITSDGQTKSANGLLSFGKEAAKGQHLCELESSVYDEGKKVIVGFVPVIINEKVSALLFDEIDIDAATKKWAPNMYDGEAKYTIVECQTGEVMLSSCDAVTTNIAEIGNDQLVSEVMKRKNGYTAFPIRGDLTFACYVPMQVADWEIIFFVSSEKTLSSSTKMRDNFRFFLIEEGAIFLLFMIWIIRSNKKSIKDTEETANSDALTNLPNRNMFEHYCRQKSESTDDLACIYIDVNGLHEVNNTQGHSAGDRMLKSIADILKVAFSGAELFRIGGDEFVIFQENGSGTGINLKLRSVKEQLKKNDYHISAGVSFGNEGTDINDVVKDAEKKMFDNKKAYYEKIGKQVRNGIHMPTEIDNDDAK